MPRAVEELADQARDLVTPGKVLLAADEPASAVERHFRWAGLSSTVDARRALRQALFTTPGLAEHVSGVVLSDEAIRQRATHGPSFTELLAERRIIPGIRVDLGQRRLSDMSREGVTAGVERLADRLGEYRRRDARFASWRAYCLVDGEVPTETCIRTNAVRLAHFADLAQQAGLLPVVDVRIAPYGDHDIESGRRTMEDALATLVAELCVHHASIEGLLIGASLIAPNQGFIEEVDPEAVVTATLGCLRRQVPQEVPGVVLGADSLPADVVARSYAKIQRRRDLPWPLSFALGPDAIASALRAWARHDRDGHAAQDALRRWTTRLATGDGGPRATSAVAHAA